MMQSHKNSLPPLVPHHGVKKTIFIGNKKYRRSRLKKKKRSEEIPQSLQKRMKNKDECDELHHQMLSPAENIKKKEKYSLEIPSLSPYSSNFPSRKSKSQKKKRKKESSFRKNLKEIKAAIIIQQRIRGYLATCLIRILKRKELFRLAAKSGVLLVSFSTFSCHILVYHLGALQNGHIKFIE